MCVCSHSALIKLSSLHERFSLLFISVSEEAMWFCVSRSVLPKAINLSYIFKHVSNTAAEHLSAAVRGAETVSTFFQFLSTQFKNSNVSVAPYDTVITLLDYFYSYQGFSSRPF